MEKLFSGWKRKLGVVTLLLACVFTAGWTRSLSIADQINLPTRISTKYHIIESVNGSFRWCYFDCFTNNVHCTRIRWMTHLRSEWPGIFTFDAPENDYVPFEMKFRFYDWRFRRWGFGAGKIKADEISIANMSCWFAPYWSVVFPLTVLSAWLLLSNRVEPSKPHHWSPPRTEDRNVSYFKPWQRKIGVLTLVVACLCMAAWMRSFITFDALYAPSGQFISSNGGIYGELSVEMLLDFKFSYASTDANVKGRDYYNDPNMVRKFWHWRFFGLAYGFQPADREQAILFIVPYWSLVIPLAALSGYLFLSKPRSRSTAPENQPA